MILLDKNIHPISELQKRLRGGEHLRQLAKLNIDKKQQTQHFMHYTKKDEKVITQQMAHGYRWHATKQAHARQDISCNS